ncbi:hypothetical protein Taro_046213 [Colocasia esculenta]|uniref:Uncharacterized protein n=1 Tax=Colocasia esculenta TaxID=4460 RepID=A0A843WT74_COLES|nr:hypothetical protein [Colocasia esculenta]
MCCLDCWLYIFYSRTSFFAGLGSGAWVSGPLQSIIRASLWRMQLPLFQLVLIHLIGRRCVKNGILETSRCKELPNGTEQWGDDESRSRYERMIQLSTPSLDSESGSTPISAEEAFVLVMGTDRSGRIRYGGSRETLRTWYGTGEGSSSSADQQQISSREDILRTWDSEMDEMQRELEQLRRRESEMEDIRRQMLQMSTFIAQFHSSRGAVVPLRALEGALDDGEDDTEEARDDYDD